MMTLEAYGRLLALAPPTFRFGDVLPADALLLRHDIDDRPCWIEPMARTEAALGAVSTYCLQLASEFYPLDAEADRAVAVLLECGHELGLHFDSTPIGSDDEVAARVVDGAAALGARYGVEVRVVSFHQPGVRPVSDVRLPEPLINTYAPRFFSEIGYLSDSNQDFRGNDPEAVLRAGGQIQFLTHPTLWSGRTMREILEEQAQRLGTSVDALATDHQKQVMAAQPC